MPKSPSTKKTMAKEYIPALSYVMAEKNLSIFAASVRVGKYAAFKKKIDDSTVGTFAETLKKAYIRSRQPRKRKIDKRRVLSERQEQLVAGVAMGMARAGEKVTKSIVVEIANRVRSKRAPKSMYSHKWSMPAAQHPHCSGGLDSRRELNSPSRGIRAKGPPVPAQVT